MFAVLKRRIADDGGVKGGIMQDQKRAEYHAREAERLLAGRLGIITNMVKAGVHATLAVYYSTQVTPK